MLNSTDNSFVEATFKNSVSSFFMDSKIQVEVLERAQWSGLPGEVPDLLSVVGGAGRFFQASLLVILNSSLARLTHPKVASDPASSVNQNEAEDWCGEVSNQILGRFKNLMLTTAGVDFTLAVPVTQIGKYLSVEQAFDLKLHNDAKTVSFRVKSSSGEGIFMLQYYSETDFEKISTVGSDSKAGLEEGDALLF